MKRYPSYVLYGMFPLLGVILYGFFKKIWLARGILPHYVIYLKNTSDEELAWNYCAFSLIPLFTMVLVASLTRLFTGGGDDKDAFLTINRNVLTNTVEQTLLFVVNLIGITSFGTLAREQIGLFAIVFVLSRFFYWGMYFLAAQSRYYPLKSIAFLVTYVNNMAMMVYTVTRASKEMHLMEFAQGLFERSSLVK